MMGQADAACVLDRLPPTAGRVQRNALLGPATWFRVGGPAEILLRPADTDDLMRFLAALPLESPVTVLGAASNLIIRDGGIPGVVIRLARGFGDIVIDGTTIIAGAAVLDATLAARAAEAGLGGLAFFSGIPGTVGGAVAMNAGAYGADTASCLIWAEIVTRQGALLRLSASELQFGYRHCRLPPESVVVRAAFAARPAAAASIAASMAEIRASREAAQPVRARTGGSTFRNPHHARAWELIDAAGCRGLVLGGAQISEKHCNFMINIGGASAADLEGLGEEVRRRVQAACGTSLEWEIKRLGISAASTGACA